MYMIGLVSRLNWDEQLSSLSVVLHKQRFPIAPQWTPPTFTCCLTPTECLEASDSAENAPAMLPRWNDGMLPSIRWVRWGGRGDELRLRGVVPGSHGTDQTLATVGGRPTLKPTSVNRHRSRVVGHSAHEGHLCSRCAWIHACRLQWRTAAGGRCAPLKSADTDPSTARAQVPRIFIFEMSEMKIRTR